MKKIKRIMCILLSLTMVFHVFTILPVTADADDEENAQISYVDRQWNDSTRKVESSTKYVNGDTVTEFTSNLVNLDTWYLVKGSVNVTHRLYVRGSATLILADGARLYCKDGINVSKGNTLNIYCQTQETGELYCDADTNDNAAIGADDEAGGCGRINIYGGNIIADTDNLGTDGAGIGGGDEGNGGTVVIYGGNVTAIGGKYGAGIGGGDADEAGGLGGVTIIYGGTVNATGGRHAAGIGGGEEGEGGLVEIWGGVVKATGGDGAAAIGGGDEGNGGPVMIAGGEVTAIAGEDAAAIGYGYGRSKDSLELGSMKVVSGNSEGSAVLQTADQRQAGCRMSYAKVALCTEHTFEKTAVIDNADTHSYHCIYCDFTDEEHTHPHDIKILNWKWADDYSSAMVSVSCDTCGYSDDITASGGQIREEITDAESGERRLTASITINGVEYTDSLIKYKTEYVDLNGDVQQTGYIDKITADTKDLSSGWYFAAADITDKNRIDCNGDINLILRDGVTLNNPAGISVNQGNSLTIWGQTEGTGKLIITSPSDGIAGIGGDKADSGQITINGGCITAKGGSYAAAIGGSKNKKGTVTVNGGVITANAGGIGSGWEKSPKGSVTLGYGYGGVTIYSYEYHNTDITLAKPFTDGTNTYEAKEYGSENENTFKDKTIYPQDAFTVEWKNYDGTLLQKKYVMPGTMPVYTGEKPARASELDDYAYSFIGWTPEISAATENSSYTAQFELGLRVLIRDVPYGKVTSNVEGAKPGDTVTLELKPKAGSRLVKLNAYTVTQNSTRVPLTALDGQGGTGDEGYPKLVDGDINTKWYVPFNGSNYVIFKADEPVTMDAYTLTTANDTKDYGGRNWRDWTIYGANFGSDSEAVRDSEKWQEITSVVNDQRLPAANFTQVKYLPGESVTSYQYYMIEVTGKGGSDQWGNNIQMAEFTIYDHFLDAPVELSGSGGTRTFTMPDSPVIVCAEFEHESVFVGYNLSLGGDIGLIYYLDITDEEAENNSVNFNWSYFDGGERKSKTHTCKLEKDEEDGLYYAVCPVSAAEMIYGINASIIVDGDRYTDNYAVFRFADKILTGEGFAKSYIEYVNLRGGNGEEKLGQLRTLMKAMLDYGSAAQVYFNRAPELLVNSEFVTDDPESPYYYVPEEVTADMIHTESSNMSAGLNKYGLKYVGSTLVYESKTTLRHYYKVLDARLASYELKDRFRAYMNGQRVYYHAKGDLIYFEITDISAQDLDKTFVLNIMGTEYKYCALDYVKECLTSKDTSEELKNLARATYRYNKAANIFFDEEGGN